MKIQFDYQLARFRVTVASFFLVLLLLVHQCMFKLSCETLSQLWNSRKNIQKVLKKIGTRNHQNYC